MDTKVNEATKGVASVHIVRPTKMDRPHKEEFCVSHNSDILFTFILNGKIELKVNGYEPQLLNKGDAFITPPDLKYHLSHFSEDLEFLEVSLPGNFKTTYY